jgi:hypothetical protein
VGLAAIAITFSTLFAAGENPSALGLEIGKATIADAKAKYRLESKGINNLSEGEYFLVELSDIKLDNVIEASIVFDKSGKLAAVGIIFSGDRFDSLYKSLSEQYALQNDQTEFQGVKSAIFVAGNSKIILAKWHTFERKNTFTNLHYGTNQHLDKIENAIRQQQDSNITIVDPFP